MAPTVVTRRARLRATLAGFPLAGHPSVRRFFGMVSDTCQTGLKTLLRIGLQWAGARWTPWIALGLVAAFSMLPPRFAGEARLMFEVGTQPPAAIVNGTAQLLASRELANDAIRRLSAQDVARLASTSLFAISPVSAQTDAAEAARNLRAALHVEPIQGGRGLEITLAAPSPALAARAADAYVTAMLELDSAARARAVEQHHMPLPPVRRDAPATSTWLPELPSPLTLLLLMLATGTLVFIRRQRSPEPELNGVVDQNELPQELHLPSRVTWVDDGAENGLPLATAIQRLRMRLPARKEDAEKGRITLFTAENDADAAAQTALAFARQQAEGAGVVIVFLEDTPITADALDSESKLLGLHDLLCGKADFIDATSRDPKSRAHVIRAGHFLDEQMLSTHDRHLCTLLDVMCQAYEEVVVLAPSFSRLPSRLAQLKPVTICVQEAGAPPTAGVESCASLAARNYSHIAILRLAQEQTGEESDDARLPVPTLDATARQRTALPALTPSQGPGWPFPELVRAA